MRFEIITDKTIAPVTGVLAGDPQHKLKLNPLTKSEKPKLPFWDDSEN